MAGEQASVKSLEEERQRLRDIADRLRGLIDVRDQRLAELEDQVERVMSGPKSISAEHDYLVEQIEDLKRRLLERNREYESLRRRERRLHNDVFERDERLAQMTLTMTDLEAALQDRTAELRDLETRAADAEGEVERQRRGERTREVVGKAFSDTLGLVRGHDQREAARAAYADAPDVERRISAPTVEDIERLAEGEEIDLAVDVTPVPVGDEVEEDRPPTPGGKGDPVVYDEDRADNPLNTSSKACTKASVSAVSSISVPVTTQSAPASTARPTDVPSRNPPPTMRVRPGTSRAARIRSEVTGASAPDPASRYSRRKPYIEAVKALALTRPMSSGWTRSALPTRPTSPPGAMTRYPVGTVSMSNWSM